MADISYDLNFEAQLENTESLEEIMANQPVTDFLQQINSNFEKIVKQINYIYDELQTKQKMITVSTDSPSSEDGNDGDIWITYEDSQT